MSTPLLLAIYCLLIVAASLAGGWLPYWIALSHRQMQLAMSAVGGFMLGIALLHLIPHAHAELGNLDQTVGWTLSGLVQRAAARAAMRVRTAPPSLVPVAPPRPTW